MARQLAEITRLPLYVLDKLQFREGGAAVPHDEYLALHRDLLARETWVIDGYGDDTTIWERFRAADTLIHVDLTLPVHYWRVTKRLIKGLFADPEGWPKDSPLWSSTMSSYKTIPLCHRYMTPRYRRLVAEMAASKRVAHLRSPGEMAAFLDDVRNEFHCWLGRDWTRSMPMGLARRRRPRRDAEGGVKGNSRAVYRFRRETRFAKPPAAIWPFVSDTARLWDLNGYAPVQFEERVDGQGRVRRFVNGKLGFFPARWEEDFGEWQENHRLFQVRNYQNGPMRRWEWACELIAEGEGCRLIFTGMAEPAGLLGFVGKHAGVFDAEFGKAAAGIERIIRESDGSALVPGWSVEDLVEPAARQRLDALGAELARDPASHALGPNLIDYLRHAPIVDLRSIRPVALATLWSAPPDHAVELFLAAARKGVVAMGWELLCPRCRGAKSRVSRLQDLPKGAHCSSCNIDYERNFSRNVELTFHPAPWIRPLLGRGDVHARPGLRAAHQVSGRGCGAVGQDL